MRRLTVTDATYAQVRSELGTDASDAADPVEWLALIAVLHETVWGAEVLRRTHGDADPVPWPEVVGALERAAADTADHLRGLSGRLVGTGPAALVTRGPVPALDGLPPTADPDVALLAADVWGWLAALQRDTGRVAAPATGASATIP